jgi:broad specificity phosphatase PhoE
MHEVAARARGFFRELAQDGGPARIAIVAHGGVIRSLCDEVGPLANADFVRTTLAALVAD